MGDKGSSPPETNVPEADRETARIGVVGLGHVGLPLALTLAEGGYQVTGYEKNSKRKSSLQRGNLPIQEAGLDQLLKRHLSKRFTVRTELGNQTHSTYALTVGTSLQESTKEPELRALKSACRELGSVLSGQELILLRSTVPLGTTREVVLPLLEEPNDLTEGKDFSLVYAPERTVQGRAFEELHEVPQIIGGFTPEATKRARVLFENITDTVLTVSDPETAELSKLVDNGYRDLQFAFANLVSQICEGWEINTEELRRSVNTNYSRTELPKPSPGVGGSCLSTTPYFLVESGKDVEVDVSLLEQARETNQEMPIKIMNKTLDLLREVRPSTAGPTLLILGLAFKGDPPVEDTRASPSVQLLSHLRDELPEAELRGYDPSVNEEQLKDLPVQPVRKLSEGFAETDAVIVMTNHPEFSDLNLSELLPLMNEPGIFVDGWGLYSPQTVESAGNTVYGGIGVG